MTDTTTQGSLVDARTEPDGRTVLTINGSSETLRANSLDEARLAVLTRARTIAAESTTPVQLSTQEPSGAWLLLVHPDGHVEDITRTAPTPTAHAPSAPPSRTQTWPPAPPTSPPATSATTVASAGPAPTFLTPGTDRPVARAGWRGALNKVGLTLAPGADEQRYLEDVEAVSQHWPGPRTIAVINGKGGSAKTPTTIGLSSTFALYGGGGVVAWSNHQMRGTLGWHTVQSPHAATTQDLLTAAPDLLATAGQSSALAAYVHHQPADRYDVLQADPTKTSDQQRTNHAAIDTLHALLSRFYRLVIMDSDNDESTTHWLRMIDKADLIVVATTTDAVRAEAGRLMLDTLQTRNAHAKELADKAVVIVSQAHADEPPAEGVARQFRDQLGLQAATIPYDQGMKRLKITHGGLQPATQRAYLAAAAVVARSL